MRRSSQTSLIALATACAFAATPAFAQDTTEAAQPAADAAQPAAEPAASGGVADIVVTATRRSENLQDIPLSVATVSDETLAAVNSGGADIRGLSGRVPSLNIESSFGRTFPRFYIRGLGNTDFDLNASQPVSLVYDDVVLENPILKGFPAFDVDRIEVLRGPQGTLFGRNTPAGIVKFDTVRPDVNNHNYARLSYGSYSTINAEAAVGGEVSDGVSVRVSGLWQHRNDWIDNLDEPGSNDLEGYDDIALRGQIQWEPTDELKIRLTGQYRNLDGNARIFRANSFLPGSNKLVGADGGDFKRDEVRQDGINFQDLTTWNAAGTVEYDFGPLTLYSVTSYWHGKLDSRGDIDGGFGCALHFLPFCPANSGPGDIPFTAQSQDNIPDLDQFTQEVRVASNNSGGFGYQAGIFYFNEDLEIESFDFGFPTDTTPDAIALQHQESKALGIFGSVNYAFDMGLTLQAGARWNHDEKDMVAGRPVDDRPLFLGFGGPVDPPKTADVSDSVLTWDVSAIQELNPDINIYARIAKGYRAPSIQGRLLFGRDLSLADSETTMSYEAGIKTVLFDRRVRFNLTGYFFNTKDLQLTAVGGANNFTSLLNADKVKGSGFEAELEARPVTGLSLTTGVSYNHTKIHDDQLFVAGCGSVPACTVLDPQRPGSPGIFLIDGNSLPQAPKWTVNFTAGYEHPVGPGSVYVFTDWYHRSKVDFFLYKSVEFSDDQLLEGGLRIGYKTDRYDVAGFVRNITNDESAVSGIDFNNLTAMVNEPRIWGVEVGVKF
jgi:iron complex outermembrane receptor protein